MKTVVTLEQLSGYRALPDFPNSMDEFTCGDRTVRHGISGFIGRWWTCLENDQQKGMTFNRSTAEQFLRGKDVHLSKQLW